MTFYQQLSKYYDEVFPAGEAEMRFVRNVLAGRGRILDIGCGTGNKTEVLARGVEAVAFDADPGMIAAARRDHSPGNIVYEVLDMLAMDGAFAPASFDAALCLGNTMAHLAHPDDLSAFLRQVRRVLADGGVFVGQILNYDRIIARSVVELPLIETDRVRFARSYEWRGGDMHFVTELTIGDAGETFRNDIVLRPILAAELGAALTGAGFRRLERYGGYAGVPFDADSFHLIVVAHVSDGR